MTPTRYVNVEAVAQRYGGHRTARLGHFLSIGDPLADAAVGELASRSKPEQDQLMTGLLGHGSLPPGLGALRDSVNATPVWVDLPRVDRGGELLLRHGLLSGLVLAFKSLAVGYCSPAGNKPLAFSARLTGDVSRRLGETAKFVEAVSLPRGMALGAGGLASTVKVRLMHARVRQGLRHSPRWDHSAWGLPINQYDMAGTILMFSLVLIDGLRQLGVRVSREEEENVLHLWRFVGHVMGVDHELLSASREEADVLWNVIEGTQAPPDDDSRRLTHALIDSAKERGAPRPYVAFTSALCRHFLGPTLADALHLERSAWTIAPPLVRAFVRPLEGAIRAVPGGRGAALKVGMLYWKRTTEVGQGHLTTFPLPNVEHFSTPPAR
jgi:hypothetical protein